MNFLKTSEGGWVISDPRNYVADFSVLNKHFCLLNFCCRYLYLPFGVFPKIHPNLIIQSSLNFTLTMLHIQHICHAFGILNKFDDVRI